MAELVDALGSGPSGVFPRAGSIPVFGTNKIKVLAFFGPTPLGHFLCLGQRFGQQFAKYSSI